MNEKLADKRNVTSRKAIEMLKKNGVEIDKKKADELLDLLYFLAKLIVNQNFNK